MPKRIESQSESQVVYPELEVRKYLGDEAMDADQMKVILGWEVVPPGAGKDMVPLFTDMEGNEIRLANNAKNRPFYRDWAEQLAYVILNRRWADSRNGEGRTINGETMSVGRDGNVLSAQHRGVGLVLAQQLLDGPQRGLWKKNWPDGKVSIECLITFGVDESADTIATLDNTRSRTLADALYSEGETFKKSKPTEREKLCRIMEYAVREIWARTGLGIDQYQQFGAVPEMLDFVSRHSYLEKAILHVWTENRYDKGEPKPAGAAGKVQKYIGLGYAAALLYLMAYSTSDGERWRKGGVMRNQSRLDGSRKDLAETFWTLLASNAEELKAVRDAKRPTDKALLFAKGDHTGSKQERTGTLIRAFQAFADGQAVTAAAIKLGYSPPNEEGERKLNEQPSLGGIDLGPAPEVLPEDETAEAPRPKRRAKGEADGGLDETDAEEIERRKQEVKEQSLAATRDDHEVPGDSHTEGNGEAPTPAKKGRKKPVPAHTHEEEKE